MKYFKILNEKEKHYNLQYKTGLNVDLIPFNPTGTCQPGGIYFSDTEHICEFLNFGIWIREVIIPEDVKIYKDSEGNKYKANKVIFGERKSLKEVSTWKWMKEQDIIFTDYTVNWASANGHLEVVKFLCEQGIKPTKNAIDYASEKGHLEVVKFLFEQGVRPSGDAINWASTNGHLCVVKFFIEQGIRPTYYTIGLASRNGHLEIVKFLWEQGVRPTKYAINWAFRNGHLEIVKFLKENM